MIERNIRNMEGSKQLFCKLQLSFLVELSPSNTSIFYKNKVYKNKALVAKNKEHIKALRSIKGKERLHLNSF